VELIRDLLVAASLREQVQNLVVAWGDFHFVEVDHGFGCSFLPSGATLRFSDRSSDDCTGFAKPSLPPRK
jgi:hypothetical protein